MLRLWQAACVAKAFGVLPSQAARDLDNDPDRVSLACLKLLRYSEAKEVYDSNDPRAISAWEGSRMMELVKEIDFERTAEELGIGDE